MNDLSETNRKIALAKKAHDEGRAVPAKVGFARLSKKLALKYPNSGFEEFAPKNPPQD